MLSKCLEVNVHNPSSSSVRGPYSDFTAVPNNFSNKRFGAKQIVTSIFEIAMVELCIWQPKYDRNLRVVPHKPVLQHKGYPRIGLNEREQTGPKR